MSGLIDLYAINAFSKVATPVTTAGAYAAGSIVGGLMEFDVARGVGLPVILQEVMVTWKSAVQPVLRLVPFVADPTSTTKTNGSAYSLAAADAFKARPTINLSGYNNHGTPKSVSLALAGRPFVPAADSIKLFALLVTDTAMTLGSTADLQVVLSGFN